MKTKTLPRLPCMLLALAAAILSTLATTAKEPAPAARPGRIQAAAAFERLKTLAGNWEGTSDEMKDKAAVRYQVTSAGSVVMETIGPGTPHEMVTMYHLDGDDLVLVHYCAARNQPRMKLDRKKSTADDLVFNFDGGTNINPRKDGHMHALRLSFTGADTVEARWTYFKDGKSGGVTAFKLERKKA